MQGVPERFVARCELGGEEIDTRVEGVHQWMSGWVKQRDAGGGHGISCAVRENRWACSYHVDRAARGLTGQGRMF